jgi:uncharacterized glyoxalase superfamily protein PhnB
MYRHFAGRTLNVSIWCIMPCRQLRLITETRDLLPTAHHERRDIMALELYMLGLIVQDMPEALQFYRRLGLAIPDGSEMRTHVEIKMGSGFTFFLDSNPTRWDPGFEAFPEAEQRTIANRYPMILEFYLKEQTALVAKYAELIDYGYQGYREPYRTSFGMYFAMIQDPDGNTILLSADATDDREAQA